MNNKATGTKFEREFAELLAKHWFWVHIFQDNWNGQPCDVVAAKDGRTYLFDCKHCEEDFFLLSRMEENQYNAMKLFDMTGNGKGMLAIRFPDGGTYLIGYDKTKELQDAGFRRINGTVCRAQGEDLREWIRRHESGDEGDADADRDWK